MNTVQAKKYRALAKFIRERVNVEQYDLPPADPRRVRPALLLWDATAAYFLAVLDYAESATNGQSRAMRMQEVHRFAARLATIAQRWSYHPDYRQDWTS